MKSAKPGWQWNNYWNQGTVTTFSEGNFETGYIGPIKDFWIEQFARLGQSAVIVDLATGNGAIPLIAAHYMKSTGKDWRIVGVDYADIKPPIENIKELSSVTFHSSTPIENTNIETSSVDLVTSQYGIEYADLDKAVGEVHRILKQGAAFSVVMHHPESLVVKQSTRDIFQTRLCLEVEEFDKKVENLISIVGDARTPQQKKQLKNNPDAENAREQINTSLERIYRELAEQEADQMLKITQTFLRVFGDLSYKSKQDKIDFIKEVSNSMLAYSARMESMKKASLDDSEYMLFVENLRKSGFHIKESGLLKDENKGILGRNLHAIRSV